MDICAYCNKSAYENVSHFGLSPGSLPCEDNSTLDFGVDDLRNHLSDLVIIQEDKQLCNTTAPKFSKDDGFANIFHSPSSSLASKKCISKFATFPSSSKSTSPNELIHREKEQINDVTAEPEAPNGDGNTAQPPSHSNFLSSATKLVSAMKGSREKQGIPCKKLSVKWASDVYDPVPTSVSHVPKNKPQRHRSDGRKNGKNKQKNSGKSSRANKGKDKKKQAIKYGGSSKRGFYPLDDNSTLTSSCQQPAGIVDYDVDRPDPFCGSSFLKTSVTKLHFPFAEAT